jgi:threonine/homoserine/homoserine lactone efflux protein
MDLANLLFFAVPFAIAAVVPGPVQAALVAQVLSRGSSGATPFVMGIVAGNALWLTAAIYGLSAVAFHFAWVFIAVKWLGAIYILVVAWQLWNASTDLRQTTKVYRTGAITGLALSLGNPKAVVFFGAILPQAFDLRTVTSADVPLILGLGVLIDTLVQLTYVVAAARARRLLESPRRVRVVNRSAAILMAGSATVVVARG